jgi:hypothetical protein
LEVKLIKLPIYESAAEPEPEPEAEPGFDLDALSEAIIFEIPQS